MTTVVAVKKGDRVCIAADTMARYGSTCESADFIENHDKLLSIGDAWLAPTGPASAQLVLRNYFSRPDRRANFGGLDAIFETMRELQSALKDDYYLNPKEDEEDPFDSMQMEILIASPSGIFGVYPLRSIQQYKRFYAFGSGATYALGAMQVLFDTLETPEEIAARGIEAAACFDSSTGLPMTLQSIPLDLESRRHPSPTLTNR